MIAAPRSGSGKTTVTLGLLMALRARGVEVRAAKAGPDYIDPGFHAAATRVASVNLDGWAMPPGLVASLAHGSGDGLLIVEAAMGLFDGAGRPGPGGGDGSAAGLARALGLPVVLVLDVSGQGQSAAAVAHGFATLDPAVEIAGVVLNQVASPRHQARIEEAMRRSRMRVLGAVRRDPSLALPSRHLGLVQAAERDGLAMHLRHLGERVGASVALDAIIAAASPLRRPGGEATGMIPPPGQRIALARDEAFGFSYPHVLAGWRDAGAEIIPFSPLLDAAPDPDADACWLPGGYPELNAGLLAGNRRFMDGLRRAASRGPVHGECGGFMVLGRGLVDADGTRHVMAGLLDHETSFAARRLHLGYRSALLAADCALGRRGTLIAGHEFHHATLTSAGHDQRLAALTDAEGAPLGDHGAVAGRVSGSFFHAIARHPPP